MRKGCLLLFCFLLVLPTVFAARSWVFRYTPACSLCWEGFVVNSSLEIRNTGDEPLVIKSIYLKDNTGLVFFASPDASSSIPPGESATYNFPVHLPPPSRGLTLFYFPCLVLPDGTSCSADPGRLIIKPLSELECTSDANCADDERCLNFECKRFYCSGRIENHTCLPAGFNILWAMAAIALILLLLGFFWVLSRGRRAY